MIAPAHAGVLVESSETCAFRRRQRETPRSVCVQVAAACDYGGGDDGEEVAVAGVLRDLLQIPDVLGEHGRLDSDDQVRMPRSQLDQSRDASIDVVPCAFVAANLVMPVVCGIEGAGDDQLQPRSAHRFKHLGDHSKDAVGKDPVGGDGDRSQSFQVSLLEFTDAQHERDKVVAQERLAAGDVQLPHIGKKLAGEKGDPVFEGQVGHRLRDVPDVAHHAPADATMGDLETHCLRFPWSSGQTKAAVAETVPDEARSYYSCDSQIPHDFIVSLPHLERAWTELNE